MTAVSSSQQGHLPCLLILRIHAGPPNLNDGVGTCLEFFRCTFLQATNASSLHLVSRFLYDRYRPVPPHFFHIANSSTRTHYFIPVVLTFARDFYPVTRLPVPHVMSVLHIFIS